MVTGSPRLPGHPQTEPAAAICGQRRPERSPKFINADDSVPVSCRFFIFHAQAHLSVFAIAVAGPFMLDFSVGCQDRGPRILRNGGAGFAVRIFQNDEVLAPMNWKRNAMRPASRIGGHHVGIGVARGAISADQPNGRHRMVAGWRRLAGRRGAPSSKTRPPLDLLRAGQDVLARPAGLITAISIPPARFAAAQQQASITDGDRASAP